MPSVPDAPQAWGWSIARRDQPPPQSSQDFVPTNEAAEQLGVSPATIRRAINRGELPAWRRGGWWFIPPHALQTWQPRRRAR